MTTVSTETTARRHDAVIGQSRNRRRPHDVADRPSGSRTPRKCGYLPVGGEAARRDPAHDAQHPQREFLWHVAYLVAIAAGCRAIVKACPSALGKAMPAIAASVGAKSAGVAASA